MLSAFQDELSWLKLASRERGFIAGGSRFEAADSQIAFLCFIYLQWQHLRSVSRGERGSWTIIENPEWGEILLHFIPMPLFLISSVWWCIVVFLRSVCGTPHEGTRRPTYCCSYTELVWIISTAFVWPFCDCCFITEDSVKEERERVIWSCWNHVHSALLLLNHWSSLL